MHLGEYIALHYINDHPNDQDDQEDNELPFKEHLAQHVDLGLLPGQMEINYFMDPVAIKSPGNIGIPQLQPYSIFRPPQLV